MSDDVTVVSTFGSDDECAHAMEALHAAHLRDFHAILAVSEREDNRSLFGVE